MLNMISLAFLSREPQLLISTRHPWIAEFAGTSDNYGRQLVAHLLGMEAQVFSCARYSPICQCHLCPASILLFTRECYLDPKLTATLCKHSCPTRCLRVFSELWKPCNGNKTFRPVNICDPARKQHNMQGRHTTPALFRDPHQYAPSVRSKSLFIFSPFATRVTVHWILSLASFKRAMVLDMLLPLGTTVRASSPS